LRLLIGIQFLLAPPTGIDPKLGGALFAAEVGVPAAALIVAKYSRSAHLCTTRTPFQNRGDP